MAIRRISDLEPAMTDVLSSSLSSTYMEVSQPIDLADNKYMFKSKRISIEELAKLVKIYIENH